MSDQLTHFDEEGKAIMVEVGDKAPTQRLAIARGEVRMQETTLGRILDGDLSKGDVLAVARLAGIMAAKKTPGNTGVEMEALTAVSGAALTIYDMCKAVDKGIEIHAIRLMEKHGGKSGSYVRST